jgi:hypothetical protein
MKNWMKVSFRQVNCRWIRNNSYTVWTITRKKTVLNNKT